MKTIVITLFLLLGSFTTFGFQVNYHHSQSKTSSSTSLNMGLFDLKPFHGSGSAKDNELDEQWRIQQEILKNRRGHLDKAHLKEKYKSGDVKFDVHSMSLQKSHMDDMYVEGDDNLSQEKITTSNNKKKVGPSFSLKMPWEKK